MVCFINLDQDIIKIDNDKDIELFCKNLIDVVLETCGGVDQAKQYYFILEMAVLSLEAIFYLFPSQICIR